MGSDQKGKRLAIWPNEEYNVIANLSMLLIFVSLASLFLVVFRVLWFLVFLSLASSSNYLSMAGVYGCYNTLVGITP